MADIQCVYTLTTPGPDITFNAGTFGDGTNKYWLTAPPTGLDGPTLRTPWDPVPFGDGGIGHTFWKGPRLPVFNGMFLIESSTQQSVCQQLRNDLIEDLNDALDSILSPNTGTLSWTPAGQAARSLTVSYFVALETPVSDNYMVQNFSFGLFSEAADPS